MFKVNENKHAWSKKRIDPVCVCVGVCTLSVHIFLGCDTSYEDGSRPFSLLPSSATQSVSPLPSFAGQEPQPRPCDG